MKIKVPKAIESHWQPIMLALVVLVIYLAVTRTTKRVIGTVDVSGDGMTVNGV